MTPAEIVGRLDTISEPQSGLAEATFYSESAISRFLSGERRIHAKAAATIEEGLRRLEARARQRSDEEKRMARERLAHEAAVLAAIESERTREAALASAESKFQETVFTGRASS